MAITAVNMVPVGQGPTVTKQPNFADQTSGPLSKRLVFYGTATCDAQNSTTFVANWIDGSATPFCTWSGPAGNQTGTATVPAAAIVGMAAPAASNPETTAICIGVSQLTTTGCTITLNTNGTSGNKINFIVVVYPFLT